MRSPEVWLELGASFDSELKDPSLQLLDLLGTRAQDAYHSISLAQSLSSSALFPFSFSPPSVMANGV